MVSPAESRVANCGKRYIHNMSEKNGPKYDYSESVYIGRHKPITIRCKKHGYFTLDAGSHLSGAGCRECRSENITAPNKKDSEKFIRDAVKKYGNFFDYSNVLYENCKIKVKIVCPVHGEFEQTPDAHLQQKYGCPFCGVEYGRSKSLMSGTKPTVRKKDHAVFVKELQEKYPNKVLVLGTYSGSHDKILCRCHKCDHEWEPTPTGLLGGKGCPKCKKKGFNIKKPADFYVYDLGNYIGFGITSSPKTRHRQHRKTFAKLGMIGRLITSYSGSGENILALETHLKRSLPIANSGVEGFKTEAILKQHERLLFDSIEKFLRSR